MGQLKSYRSYTDRLWPTPRKIRRSDYVLIQRIRKRAKQLELVSSQSFAEAAEDLRRQIGSGLNVLETRAVVESFALTTEALRRTTGKVYYDVQLLGGLVLATGSIAEMQTGEGKTITCGLPAALYGFAGNGVHVATTNSYLAERDHKEMSTIFDLLGLTSSLIQNEQDVSAKQKAYQCDITYGTGYEFGFDFLRDQLALRNQPRLPLGTRYLSRLRGKKTSALSLMQRSLAFGIIDEADSVLIDEATTPLILSGSGSQTTPNRDVYEQAMQVADSLIEETDFRVDEIKKSISLTETGWQDAHRQLSPQVQSCLQRPWSQYVEQSLRAKILMHSEVDYVVQNEQVVIVDPNTGRLHEERKWRSGLHQSVEVREGVPLTEEREVEARITRQRYFQFYDRVCGMTGTATGNEAELLEFYGLPVVEIPRNKPSARKRFPSRYFDRLDSKYQAMIADINARRNSGQPILVGTRTISQSLEVSRLLDEAEVEHTVLNGTQDETEASIIARAGLSDTVTIATNMAGRGTDIRLDDQAYESGGLHVIVAEHHDSPRVDRQLIGRSARQADPGSCQFFVSGEDEIITRYRPSLAKLMRRSVSSTGECRFKFDREIKELQMNIEKLNYLSRQQMVWHDRWSESVQKAVAKRA